MAAPVKPVEQTASGELVVKPASAIALKQQFQTVGEAVFARTVEHGKPPVYGFSGNCVPRFDASTLSEENQDKLTAVLRAVDRSGKYLRYSGALFVINLPTDAVEYADEALFTALASDARTDVVPFPLGMEYETARRVKSRMERDGIVGAIVVIERKAERNTEGDVIGHHLVATDLIGVKPRAKRVGRS